MARDESFRRIEQLGCFLFYAALHIDPGQAALVERSSITKAESSTPLAMLKHPYVIIALRCVTDKFVNMWVRIS